MQGAYKFGKIKFPEFSRSSNQSFPDKYKVKTRCNKSLLEDAILQFHRICLDN